MMKKNVFCLLLLLTAAVLSAKEYKLFDKLELREQQNFQFDLPAVPAGYKPVLCFTARLQNYGITGYTQALFVNVNGHNVTGDYLLNKPLHPRTSEGTLAVYIARHGFLLPYSYDFTSANKPDSPIQITLKPYDFYYFELDLSDFAKKGKNTVSMIPRSPMTKTYIVFDKTFITFKPVTAYKKLIAPTGKLPVMVPEKPEKNAIKVNQKMPLVLAHKNRLWKVSSKFSTPDGKWVTSSNAYFTHKREVKQLAEMVLVRDTFTNMTAQNLPVMQRHEVVFPAKNRKFFLGGVEKLKGKVEYKFNCTSYGSTGRSGIGLYPMNTEFQAHACNYIDKNTLGLADNCMVLPPRGQQVQSFVVVPTSRADYWQFVNAIRRQIGANFTLKNNRSGFAPVWEKQEKWSDEKLRQLAAIKDVNGIGLDTWGIMGHGEFDRKSPKLEIMRQAMKRLRRLFPGVKLSIYYHSQLIEAKDFTPYAEDRVIGKNGKPLTYYGGPGPIFFTTLTNNTGRLFEARLKMFLDMGFDAIFWDETGFSMAPYHYGKPWDGISGDIDPKTHKITQLKSSLLLLQEPWKLKMMKMMRDRNVDFSGNCTLSGGMLKMRVPTMAETDVLDNCTEMALWSPLQFGDYTSGKETMESMCRAMHRGLDYGCLYLWPSMRLPRQPISKQYKTIVSYMFPATPIELREGVVFARERILTNRSGVFGWNDNSGHEVHVFDEKGREQKNFKAPFIRRNGKTYTEIRIPRYWAAAIIRKGQIK